jgi:hypothetical protein
MKFKDEDDEILRVGSRGSGYQTRAGYVEDHAPRIMAALMGIGTRKPETCAQSAIIGANALFDAMRKFNAQYREQRI